MTNSAGHVFFMPFIRRDLKNVLGSFSARPMALWMPELGLWGGTGAALSLADGTHSKPQRSRSSPAPLVHAVTQEERGRILATARLELLGTYFYLAPPLQRGQPFTAGVSVARGEEPEDVPEHQGHRS